MVVLIRGFLLYTVITWKKLLENAQVVQRLCLRFLVTYVYKTATFFGGNVLAAIFNMLLASVTDTRNTPLMQLPDLVKYGFYECFRP